MPDTDSPGAPSGPAGPTLPGEPAGPAGPAGPAVTLGTSGASTRPGEAAAAATGAANAAQPAPRAVWTRCGASRTDPLNGVAPWSTRSMTPGAAGGKLRALTDWRDAPPPRMRNAVRKSMGFSLLVARGLRPRGARREQRGDEQDWPLHGTSPL